MDFPAKNRMVFKTGLSRRHFLNIFFLKIFVSLFLYGSWLVGRKKKCQHVWVKCCLFIKRILFEGLAIFQRISLCDFLNNQWYMSIIPTASSSFCGLLRAPCSTQCEGYWAKPTAGALGTYFENSIVATHLVSSWQFWQGSGLPWFMVQWDIFTWSPLCSFVVRTKTSAAIALWKQPPGILTLKAWIPWLHMCFMCGPGQQQGMETSVDHLSSQLTQVMTCPLISFSFP